MKKSKYKELGIDASKEAVRLAFGKANHNDFPGAFVNVLIDPENTDMAITQHMDGDGSKFLIRLLLERETGHGSFIYGAVDDALSMNTGDVAAAGFVSGLMTVTNVININGTNVPKDRIMKHIAERLVELIEIYKQNGFNIYLLGGETADLPDQVSSIAFDIALNARTKKDQIISGNVQPGDVIWGFASDGKASWEDEWNSGLMSNGLTLARQGLISKAYNIHEDLIRDDEFFKGRFKVKDEFPKKYNYQGLTVFEALVSPTRQWAILIKILIDKLKAAGLLDKLHGISMNTGGGATKIGHVGTGGIVYVKQMPEPPAIFKLIQEESGENWRNMYESFNCGIGLDVVCEKNPSVETILKEVRDRTNVGLHNLGYCVSSSEKEKNEVKLETLYGSFNDY